MKKYKNISNMPQWVAAIPTYGRTVKPGEVFEAEYDPDKVGCEDTWPRANTAFSQLLKAKKIIEAPNLVPPAAHKPVVVPEESKSPQQEETQPVPVPNVEDAPVPEQLEATPAEVPVPEPAPAAESEQNSEKSEQPRTLPVITPVATYNKDAEQITVTWSSVEGLLPTDTFSVQVEQPNGQKRTVSSHTDTEITYNVSAGAGQYTFVVVVTGTGGRKKAGKPVKITVA